MSDQQRGPQCDDPGRAFFIRLHSAKDYWRATCCGRRETMLVKLLFAALLILSTIAIARADEANAPEDPGEYLARAGYSPGSSGALASSARAMAMVDKISSAANSSFTSIVSRLPQQVARQ